jgi:hypothetical protein
MKPHRGMSELLFFLLVGGLLLLMAWMALGKYFQDTTSDPEKFKEFMVSETVTEEMAEYNVGIAYSFTALALAALDLHKLEGSYEHLCTNGKISRTNPEVLKEVTYVVCGPTMNCSEAPYVFRTEASDRCYASKDMYAFSANVYDADGKLTPVCFDSSKTESYGPTLPTPTTFRCEPI